MRQSDLPALRRAIRDLWELARAQGLDPLPTHFEVVPSPILYEVAAYGLPGRFSHWSHGKAYQSLKTQYDLGLSKCFELVIHSRPAQAFLLESNDLLTDKFVVAHVLGHTDFFAHNAHFTAVDADVAERVALHSERLRAYEFDHGQQEVERFLDALLTVEEHVDPWAGALEPPVVSAATRVAARESPPAPPSPYASLYPPAPRAKPAPRADRAEECSDLLLFLLRHAPDLEDWQRDAIAIVREEALYFRPQLRTKISNEGWATFWHTRLLRALRLADDEYTDFARLNAGVRSPHPGGINPYLLGVAIYEEVVERLGEAEGLRRCFEMREVLDDVGMLRSHFTPEVAERLDMFVFKREQEGGRPVWRVTAKDFETVRDTLIRSRENGGRPVIVAVDAEGGGGRELVLAHRHDGRDLEVGDAQQTLAKVAAVWGRRCRLLTRVEGQARELVADPPPAAPAA